MTIWLIEPHEPLIFREGKPFEATPGARAKSLPFPFPSTTTGALRSQTCLNKDGVFELPEKEEEKQQKLKALKEISVRGPLLVSLKDDGETIDQWLIPAPADALLLNVKDKDEKQAIVRQLLPLDLTKEKGKVYTDFTLKRSGEQEPLQIVGLPLDKDDSLEKPHKKAPRYWYWSAFEQWLLSPSPSSQRSVATLGTNGPTQETRVHVAMNHDTRAGKDGMLFDTSGLEFTHIKASSNKEPGELSTASANGAAACESASPDAVEKPAGSEATASSSGANVPTRLNGARRLALALITGEVCANNNETQSSTADVEITNKLGTLGGERRLVTWRESTSKPPCCPEELREQIKEKKRCRLFLLTPAYFSQGYRPTWLCRQREPSKVQPKLRAIAIQRPQVVSGWDMALKKAKPSRRLAPAGTVLFLELKGNQEEEAIDEWIDQIWFSCVSDDVNGSTENPEQYRRDGFGLAVLGAWPIETY